MSKYDFTRSRKIGLLAVLVCLVLGGCQNGPRSAEPLGTLSDPVWQNQETNAEMSDFVIYQHEFREDSEILNSYGEDHVKQIVARLASGADAQVLIEQGRMSARSATEYKYPVHPNPELDMRRREIVVRSLAAMGVSDADQRVLVAPALTPGYRAMEAEAAYHRGMHQGGGNRGGGYGGGGGGGGGIF